MINWEFKENAEPQGNSDGFWYGINEGYINPEEVLEDESQLKTLENALAVVKSFETALEENNLLGEF